MRFRLAFGFAAAGVLAVALSGWSHHAHGQYDKETIDIDGVVTELHLINPHSWIYMEVTKADGQKQLWALEGGGRREDPGIETGDPIKVRCHPLRDGAPGCLLGFVKAPNGEVADWDSSRNTDFPEDF